MHFYNWKLFFKIANVFQGPAPKSPTENGIPKKYLDTSLSVYMNESSNDLAIIYL